MTINQWIAEASGRCEAATKGPWTHIEDAPMFVGSAEMVRTPEDDINIGRVYSGYNQNLQPRYDATFIAHARTDLPKALEAVEVMAGYLASQSHDKRARRILERVREILTGAAGARVEKEVEVDEG